MGAKTKVLHLHFLVLEDVLYYCKCSVFFPQGLHMHDTIVTVPWLDLVFVLATAKVGFFPCSHKRAVILAWSHSNILTFWLLDKCLHVQNIVVLLLPNENEYSTNIPVYIQPNTASILKKLVLRDLHISKNLLISSSFMVFKVGMLGNTLIVNRQEDLCHKLW